MIKLARSVFDEIGPTLTPDEFRKGGAANNQFQHIIYNSSSGQLFFDPDGNRSDPAIQFAKLSPGLAMNAGEFLMI